MENWNPMAEAYDSRYFNSYSNGVSGNLSQRLAESSTLHQADLQHVTLYVGHVPLDMTREGLRNIFTRYGYVVRLRIMPTREDRERTIGSGQWVRPAGHRWQTWFVEMRSLQEAQLAIRGVDGQPPLQLRVKLATNSKPSVQPPVSYSVGQQMGRGRVYPNQQPLYPVQQPVMPSSPIPSLLGPIPVPAPHTVKDFDTPHHVNRWNQEDDLEDADDMSPIRDLTLVVTVKGGTSSGCPERVVTMTPDRTHYHQASGTVPLGQRPEFSNYGVHEDGDLRLLHGHSSRPAVDNRRVDGFRIRGGGVRTQGGTIGVNCSEWDSPADIDGAGDRLHQQQVDPVNEGRGTSHTGSRPRNSKVSDVQPVENVSRQLNDLNKEPCHTQDGLNSQPKGPQKQGHHIAPSGTESRRKSPQQKDIPQKNEQMGKAEVGSVTRRTDQMGEPRHRHRPTGNTDSIGNRQLTPNLPKNSYTSATSNSAELANGLRPDLKPQIYKAVPNGPRTTVSRQPSIEISSIKGKSLELPLNKAVQVEVAHCVGPDRFWVNILDQKQLLSSMIINLQEKIAARCDPVIPQVGLVCAAKYTADNIWYRCRIEKVSPVGSCFIFYVDYGNSEEISSDNLCQLSDEFLLLSPQAVSCCTVDGGTYTAEEAMKFCEFALNSALWAQTRSRNGNVHVVSLSETKPSDGENKTGNAAPTLKGLAAQQKTDISTPMPQKVDISVPAPRTVDLSTPAHCKVDNSTPAPQKVKGSMTTQKEANLDFLTPNFPSSIISKLEVGDEVTLSISFVESYLRFWSLAWFNRFQEEAQLILQDFHSTCEAMETPNCANCPASVKVLAAKSQNDGQWYRAYVTGTAPDGNRDVFYFDYGNGETVNCTMPLVDKFAVIPGFAVLCLVDDELLSANDAEYLKTNVCTENYLKFTVHQKEARFLIGDILKQNGELVAKGKLLPWTAGVDIKLSEMVPAVKASVLAAANNSLVLPVSNVVTATNVTSVCQVQAHEARFMINELPVIPDLKLNQVLPVALCFFVSSDELYVNLADNVSALCAVEELLAAISSDYSDSAGYQPLEGELVCAKYSDDNWYRAVVLKNSLNFVTVRFIDFGNVEQVAQTDLQNLPVSLKQHPPLAVKVKVLMNNEPEAPQILRDKVNSQLLMKVTNNSATIPIVEFLNLDSTPVFSKTSASQPVTELMPSTLPGVTIHDEAVPTVHAGRFYINDVAMVELPISSTIDVMVSSVESPDIIFCQLADSDALQKMNDLTGIIKNYCKDLPPSSYKPELSELCLAKYAADGEWYRAYSIEDLGSSCDVIFVDFGNIEKVVCCDIRPMPRHLMSLPCQAVHCALAHAQPSEATWTQELIARVKSILVTTRLTKAKILKKDEAVYIVEFPEFQQELINTGIPLSPATPEQDDEDEELRRLLEEEAALAAKKAEIEAKKKRFQRK